METKSIHRRLVTNTQPLFDELIKLGFKEITPIGKGTETIKVFKKYNKIIHVSFSKLILMEELNIGPKKEDHKDYSLQEIKDKRKIYFQGLTIHDEMLKFFASRNLIKKEKDD